MLVELQGAFDETVDVERLLLRRSGTRELQKILHDAGGAASLTVGEFQLAFCGIVEAFAFAQEFGDAEDGGERII